MREDALRVPGKLLPYALGDQRVHAVLAMVRERHGLRGDSERKSRCKSRYPSGCAPDPPQGRAHVPQHTRLEVPDPVERIDDAAFRVLRDGVVVRSRARGPVPASRRARRGTRSRDSRAPSARCAPARISSSADAEEREVLADRLVSEPHHFLGRRADDHMVAILHRPAEQPSRTAPPTA